MEKFLQVITEVQLEADRQTTAAQGAVLLLPPPALRLHRLQSPAAVLAPFMRLYISKRECPNYS